MTGPAPRESLRRRGSPHPIDIRVGKRIRARRRALDMSQQALARHLGVSFQQVQKYEAGTNRVSASRLADLGEALRVSPSYFLDDVAAGGRKPCFADDDRTAEELQETWELLRCYRRISDAVKRRKVLAVVRAAASASGQHR